MVELNLAENFARMHFVSDSELDDEGKVVHELVSIDFRPFVGLLAVVILVLVIVMTSIGFQIKLIVGITIAVVLFGAFVIGSLWLTNRFHKNAKLPSIDVESNELVLATGRRIKKSNIKCFRQFDCKTDISNFRLKLTSVVTLDNEQYAVCAENRRRSSGSIGKQIADYFGIEIEHDPTLIHSTEDLRLLGLQ